VEVGGSVGTRLYAPLVILLDEFGLVKEVSVSVFPKLWVSRPSSVLGLVVKFETEDRLGTK